MKVDNAIIMAAGTSSRFAPLSYERHKALTVVRDEVLIERQIEQLREAGIDDIKIITGYKAEQFDYLIEKYGVGLIHNPEYSTRNNNGSIWRARDILRNTYVCSSDNYFIINPFEKEIDGAYYAAEYADGPTHEWCMDEDEEGYVCNVTIGGENKWYMLGHTFWDEEFSKEFLSILEKEYDLPETRDKLWEKIYMSHLDTLKMKIRKYEPEQIFEFDYMDELREFDHSYYDDTRSPIIKEIAGKLNVPEREIVDMRPIRSVDFSADGFEFNCRGVRYTYTYSDKKLEEKYNG